MLNFLIGLVIAYIAGFLVTRMWSDLQEPGASDARISTEGKELLDCTLYAPVDEACIPLSNVKDDAFANKMMGNGVAFVYEGETIASPCDGTIVMVAATKHAMGIMADDGFELLLHVGLNITALNSEGFEVLKSSGDHVKKEPILQADHAFMAQKGIDVTTPMVVTNMADCHLEPQYHDAIIQDVLKVMDMYVKMRKR